MFFTLAQITQLLLQYKYFILFPIVVVEGPIISIIAGFLVSLGYLNFYIVYPLAVIGDLTGDVFMYFLGYWGGGKLIERWGKYFGIKKEAVLKIESHFKNHGGKTLILGKIFHGVGGVGLVSAGLAKMPFSKYFRFNFLATIPKSLILILIGFYFGSAILKINSYLELVPIISIAVLVIAVIAYIFYFRKGSNKYD